MLRFYRKPPFFNSNVTKIFNIIIVFGVILHLSVGIWIYGSKDIIVERNQLALNQVNLVIQNVLTVTGSISSILYNRINYNHNLIMFAFLVSFVIFLIIKYILIDILIILCGKCCKKKSENQKHDERISLDIGNGMN